MKCQKCYSEYEGEACPNCDALTDVVQNNITNKKTGKLLGFRTNKIWKKIISISYLVFCFIYLLAVIFTEKYVNITNHDFIISQICDSLIFVIMITPYIFLSNTKFRNILPFFKKHTLGASIVGLIIVTVIIGIISGIVDAAHSEEFLNDRENHAYTETVTEATCEKAGEIKKFCEYCGISETETTAALGHKMTEISRKEATKTSDGEIIEECSVCGKQEKTVLEKLQVNSSDTKENSSASETSSKSEVESNSSINNSSKENTSNTPSTIELTKYIGKTLQAMSKDLKINFIEIIDNDYFYSSDDNNTIFEIYTKNTDEIIAIKLLASGNKYTLSGLNSNMSVTDADKTLKSKGFKSIGDNKWVSKSNKDLIMFIDENWIYEKDSPLVSEEALAAKAKEVFVPMHSDSESMAYIGNGQIIELYSDSVSEFAYNISQLTDYQRTELQKNINGRYMQIHGTITSVSSEGEVIVFCNDYGEKNNMWVSGTISASVTLNLQQTDLLSSLKKDDEVIMFARINADTYDKLLGTVMLDFYDGILYSVGSKKIDIPIIDGNIEGIYRYIPTDYSAGHGGGEY